MATGFVQKLIRGSGAVALALFALPAAAVFYNSNFDPASFSGTALFEFDDVCLLTNGVHSAGSCHLQLISASADIADDGTGGTGHLDFSDLTPDSIDMVDLDIEGGTLVGVNTALIGFEFASPCTGTACGVPWWIQWTNPTDPVNLFSGSCLQIDGLQCTPDQTPVATAFNVTFTRVPEPATLVLLLAALAACVTMRRPRGRA